MKAARSHARAAFLCLRLLCVPETCSANSANTQRLLKGQQFSALPGLARPLRHMQECATRSQLSSSRCASLREALLWHRRGQTSSIPALAAFGGSAVGGLTSLLATWVTQRRKDSARRLAQERSRRQKLYKKFIEEAS